MKKSDVKRHRDSYRARQDKAGLCIMCGEEKPRPTSKLGQACHDRAVANRKVLREQRVKLGFCGQCLKNPKTEGMKLCGQCRERKRLTPNKRLSRRCKTYGITEQEYKDMLSAQNGVCAICKSGPTGRWDGLDIDHCHKTGVVRGLLCHQCNKGIGCLGDDPDRLISAAAYLKGGSSE